MKKYIYALLILSSMHQISGAATEPHETSDVVIAPHLSLEQKKLCNNLMPFYEAMTAIPGCPIALLKHVIGAFSDFSIKNRINIEKHGLLTARERKRQGLGESPRLQYETIESKKELLYPDEFDNVYFAPNTHSPQSEFHTFLSTHNWITPTHDNALIIGHLVFKRNTPTYEGIIRGRDEPIEDYNNSKTLLSEIEKLAQIKYPEVLISRTILPHELIFSYPITKEDNEKLKEAERASKNHNEKFKLLLLKLLLEEQRIREEEKQNQTTNSDE